MSLSEDDLKKLWQAATARGMGQSDCLSAEVLARAGADELSPHEAGLVAAHLSQCARCAADYRLALSVREWAAQAATDHAAIFPARTEARANAASWWPRLTGFNPLLSALTAALLIISVALGAWLVRERRQLRAQLNQQQPEAAENAALRQQLAELQRREAELRSQLEKQPASRPDEMKAEIERLKNELAELTRPQLDIPQVDPDPNSETRGAGSDQAKTAILNVPAQAASFTINLPGAGSRPFPHYLIELTDAGTNKTVWSGQRRQDGETTFTLTLAKRSLPAGQYRISVFGLDGKKELIARYNVRVNYHSQQKKQDRVTPP
ncbi:MAG: hypothetical protein U0Z53_20570 [Blastocatellia bacterium]